MHKFSQYGENRISYSCAQYMSDNTHFKNTMSKIMDQQFIAESLKSIRPETTSTRKMKIYKATEYFTPLIDQQETDTNVYL